MSASRNVVRTSGLHYWMLEVLEQCEQVSGDFSADPVHDLRVALRRCRSMADGMRAMDPDPDWKAMKKAGRDLFQRLGALRDVQVMMEWVEKLRSSHRDEGAGYSTASNDSRESNGSGSTNATDAAPSQANDGSDAVAHVLFKILVEREKQHKHEARTALEDFDQKTWQLWAKSLPQRAGRIRTGSALFKHLALERWTEAHELHARALRNRSQIALHSLRIGIKRFRYIVENFLPSEHKAWSDDLKHIQDLLGEVHDLDVLWATALSCHIFPDEQSRKSWHVRILKERNSRIADYRQKMVGPKSLWHEWRAGLPQGPQVEVLATRRMKFWASALDPDFPHSERVARLALELYDGLGAVGLLASGNGEARSELQKAALLHDVGKSKRQKGHHKESAELIRSHVAPLGWKADDLRRAAVIARFHCGALPTRSHKLLRDLLAPEQKIVIQQAAILRLANAFDAQHDGQIRRVAIEKPNAKTRQAIRPDCVVVEAEGYSSRSPIARTLAAERHLLETILRRPVMIKRMVSAGV